MRIIEAAAAPRKCAVYLATNTVNDKLYVGKSVDVRRRLKEHLQDARRVRPRSVIGRAIRKFGPAQFKFEVLEEHPDEDTALWWEGWWVQYLGTKKPSGYNITDGGRGAVGVEWTDERRQRISNALSGKKLSEAHRRALSKSHKGHRRSAEAVAKQSAARMGHAVSQETRDKISARHRGHHRPWSDARRAAQPKTITADHRIKVSVALKGKPWSHARRLAQATASRDKVQAAGHRRAGTLAAAKAPPLTVNGETLTIGAWSRRSGLPNYLIRQRLRRGWTAEMAVLTPR